eukprot:109104-Rhodomonas_salina.1
MAIEGLHGRAEEVVMHDLVIHDGLRQSRFISSPLPRGRREGGSRSGGLVQPRDHRPQFSTYSSKPIRKVSHFLLEQWQCQLPSSIRVIVAPDPCPACEPPSRLTRCLTR